MIEVLEAILPVLLFMLPVLAVVWLAVAFDRRLQGSCGGVGADGSCSRCGKPAAEMPAVGASNGSERCGP